MGQQLNSGTRTSKFSFREENPIFFLLPFVICSSSIFVFYLSFGLVKSYDMPCNIESASLEPKSGEKFVAGGEDMWVRVFDFYTGEEIGECLLRNHVQKKLL